MESAKLHEDINNIPQANDDSQETINDEAEPNSMSEGNSSSMIHGRSMDSTGSTFVNGGSSSQDNCSEPDDSSDWQEVKALLILDKLERQKLQNKMKVLSGLVKSLEVKKRMLKSINQMLAESLESLRSVADLIED